MARLVPEIDGAPRALAELAACFPVYRSYLPFGSRHLAKARSEAGRRRPQLIPALDRLTARLRDPADELAVRFQQFTGAVMAKGVEDTAFYRWTRFTARNEVGNDPAKFGVSPDEFHERRRRPAAALAGGDDHAVHPRHQAQRGRPGPARGARRAARGLDRGGAALGADRPAAGPVAGPSDLAGRGGRVADRAGAAAGVRAEGRPGSRASAPPGSTRTSGSRRRCGRWSTGSTTTESLLAEVADFAASITAPGWSNSLGQKLVQLTMPGVPDIYQGTELWDFSLVDPDNRRPVDFGARRELLARHRRRLAAAGGRDGRGETAGHQPDPAAAPAAAGAVHRLPPGVRRRPGRPTTCWPSTGVGR